MPAAAAAAVTSGSLAAPSSIEYSVCTCRCTNESDGVLTGTWCSSVVVRARRKGTPTGDRRGDTVRGVDPRIAEGLLRGSDRTCLLTPGPLRHMRPARVSGQPAAHRDVDDARLLILLADGRVAGAFVEAAGAHLGVQFDLGDPAQHRLAV